jgi:alpha-glucosidase
MARWMHGTVLALAVAVSLPADQAAGQEVAGHALRSPDGRIAVVVRAGERLEYDVTLEDRPLLRGATLSLRLGAAGADALAAGTGRPLGPGARVARAVPRIVDAILDPPVRQNAARLRDHYQELRLEMAGGWAVVFRAYDHGVAYRFETSFPGEVTVVAEEARFRFAGDFVAYYPEEESFFSHNERHFLPRALGDLAAENLASIPVVVDAGGPKVAITDADVEDYPGLWLRGTSGPALEAVFPPVVVEERAENDRDVRPAATAAYVARTRGTRTFPWRALAVAARDADLVAHPLVYLLASPSRVADTSWIVPGKVAWDWWNANNITGVPFRAGLNTETYRHYIDFAARHGLQYVILDEGWYPLGNLLQSVPAIDVPALVEYGRQRNVGVILWVIWKTLDDQLVPALDLFARWGVKGLKIDFMQRDDQWMVGFYHRVNREAAARRLLVDYHGGIRPVLMTRTWPNLMTTEGVRGMEWSKWSAHVHPEHDVTLPFTRMVAGPMDYTPGAMRNAVRGNFAARHTQPMSQGTRAHQLAMYVVYGSPLQMLADSPSNYEGEPGAMAWLSAVPAVWDETRPLDGRIADFVVVARRSGREWFVGAMTDWSAREVEVDLSFLPEGDFTIEAWADGPNAGRHGEDVQRSTAAVTRASRLRVAMAEGGGWAARIAPAKR